MRGNHSCLLAGAAVAGFVAGAVVAAAVTAGAAGGSGLAPPLPSAARADTSYRTEIIRVVDGDTFEARVSIWPGVDVSTKVRLLGIDAPEMNGRCAAEQVRADAVRSALSEILYAGEVRIAAVAPDKYGGRVLARASTRRVADVGEALLAAGLVRPYRGGRRSGWCDLSP